MNRNAAAAGWKNVEARRRFLTRRRRWRTRRPALLELVTVIVVLDLVAVPLLRIASSSVRASRAQHTEFALNAARDKPIAFAATNDGCLRFAADFTEGLRDADASGSAASNYCDTARGTTDSHGGHLPWADPGLTNSFVDGDGLSIQYYIASQYTDADGVDGKYVACAGGSRGSK